MKRRRLDRFRPVPEVSFHKHLFTRDYKLFPAPQIQSTEHYMCLETKGMYGNTYSHSVAKSWSKAAPPGCG